jgi:hypothetical protein
VANTGACNCPREAVETVSNTSKKKGLKAVKNKVKNRAFRVTILDMKYCQKLLVPLLQKCGFYLKKPYF